MFDTGGFHNYTVTYQGVSRTVVIASGWFRAARRFCWTKKTGPNSEVKNLRLLGPDMSHRDSLSSGTQKKTQVNKDGV